MILYGKITNEQTGLCEVGIGTNIEFYKSIGYIELDVKQSDIDNCYYLTEKCPMKTDEEKAKEEAKRIAELHLTGADVERALIRALNIDFEDIVAMVQAKQPEQVKMLKAELKANYFYRGNPYVEIMGNMLGLTKGKLDNFFETNDYLYLTDCTLTINPTPVDTIVTINDVIGNTVTVPYSTPIVWSVSKEGYKSQDGGLNIKEDTQLDITLEEIANADTTDKQPTIPDEVQTEGNK